MYFLHAICSWYNIHLEILPLNNSTEISNEIQTSNETLHLSSYLFIKTHLIDN